MKYRMKQRLFTWADAFTIQNHAGESVFSVSGKAFSLGHQFSFRDATGHELAYLKETLLALATTYEIYRNGALAALVTKELFTPMHCTFSVDVPGRNDIVARGDLWDLEYQFSRGDRTVATVTKLVMPSTDTYEVDVQADEDAIMVLACTVVIDMACHRGRV